MQLVNQSEMTIDKVFWIARALGPKYGDFKTAMLTKLPFQTLRQIINALHNYKRNVIAEKEAKANQDQAFFGQRGKGRNQEVVLAKVPNFTVIVKIIILITISKIEVTATTTVPNSRIHKG